MDQADLNLIRQMRQLMAEWKLRGALVPSPTGLSFDASQTGYAPRRLGTSVTSTGNSTTAETTIFSVTVPANTCEASNDAIEAVVGGSLVGHATATRTVKVKFGTAVLLTTGAFTVASDDTFRIAVTIIRTSATSLRSVTSFVAGLSQYAAYQTATISDLWATATDFVVTGQAGGVGAATDDIVGRIGYVEYKPA